MKDEHIVKEAERSRDFTAGIPRESAGTFACPICGLETPHHHTPAAVDAYHNKRSRK
jgi:hypothetical protein